MIGDYWRDLPFYGTHYTDFNPDKKIAIAVLRQDGIEGPLYRSQNFKVGLTRNGGNVISTPHVAGIRSGQ